MKETRAIAFSIVFVMLTSNDAVVLSEIDMATIEWTNPGAQHDLSYVFKVGSSVQFKNFLIKRFAE